MSVFDEIGDVIDSLATELGAETVTFTTQGGTAFSAACHSFDDSTQRVNDEMTATDDRVVSFVFRRSVIDTGASRAPRVADTITHNSVTYTVVSVTADNIYYNCDARKLTAVTDYAGENPLRERL